MIGMSWSAVWVDSGILSVMRFRLSFAILGGMHRVLLSFQLYKTKWRVGFLEADCKTSLPLKLDYTDPAKIRTIFERTAASKLLEDEQTLSHGIEIGRGGFWLNLNDDQYQVLRRRKA
jgi:hypothetical protein